MADARAPADPDLALSAAGEAMGVTEYIEPPRRELVAEAAGVDGKDAEPFSSLVPAIIGGALMMQTLSATVIANALPTMARSFGEDPVRLNTTISIYLLASAVFLPISGWMADRFGAKRVFVIAIVAYAAACAACSGVSAGASARRSRSGSSMIWVTPRISPGALMARSSRAMRSASRVSSVARGPSITAIRRAGAAVRRPPRAPAAPRA